MAMRSVIARDGAEGSFSGVICLFDAQPSGVGRTLWELYRRTFGRDLEAMATRLIDQHPAGWLTVAGNWSLPPGYQEVWRNAAPKCYCHGDRSDGPQPVDQDNAAELGCEWAYLLGRGPLDDPTMRILASVTHGEKMKGFFGFGDPAGRWVEIAAVALDKTEPAWYLFDEAGERAADAG